MRYADILTIRPQLIDGPEGYVWIQIYGTLMRPTLPTPVCLSLFHLQPPCGPSLIHPHHKDGATLNHERPSGSLCRRRSEENHSTASSAIRMLQIPCPPGTSEWLVLFLVSRQPSITVLANKIKHRFMCLRARRPPNKPFPTYDRFAAFRISGGLCRARGVPRVTGAQT